MTYLENENDFENLISNNLILVDFFTEWCGPCKMLGEVLESVDFIKILKVDADKFPNLAMKYGIMSVPTLCFFEKSNLLKKEIGFKTIDELKKIVNDLEAQN